MKRNDGYGECCRICMKEIQVSWKNSWLGCHLQNSLKKLFCRSQASKGFHLKNDEVELPKGEKCLFMHVQKEVVGLR